MNIFKIIFALFLLLFLASCSTSIVNRLKNIPREGTNFTNNLSNEYEKFAIYEIEEMVDEIDSRYFALKGIRSAQGIIVPPENPNNWKIAKEELKEIIESYNLLLSLLSTDLKDDEPKLLAKTQVSFDCWIEQQEENWQTEHIALCRNNFKKNISKLSSLLENKNIAKENTKVDKVKVEDKDKTNMKSSKTDADIQNQVNSTTSADIREKIISVIYFNFDSSTIKKDETSKLIDVFKNYKENTGIILEGHTDSSGPKNYNFKLSEKRAANVMKFLVENGINKNNITLKALGENKLQIITGDGVRESKNRRVEIIYFKY